MLLNILAFPVHFYSCIPFFFVFKSSKFFAITFTNCVSFIMLISLFLPSQGVGPTTRSRTHLSSQPRQREAHTTEHHNEDDAYQVLVQ